MGFNMAFKGLNEVAVKFHLSVKEVPVGVAGSEGMPLNQVRDCKFLICVIDKHRSVSV
jgi:hypothetical protein